MITYIAEVLIECRHYVSNYDAIECDDHELIFRHTDPSWKSSVAITTPRLATVTEIVLGTQRSNVALGLLELPGQL